MTKKLKYTALALVAIAIAIVAVTLYRAFTDKTPVDTRHITMTPARVKQISDMLELCTLDIYEETGINDTINGKGLFAIQRLRGSVSFDLNGLRVDSVGVDSIRVYLPAEKVELLESTEPGAYRVVDVWNVKYPLLATNLTVAEENALKRRASERVKDLAYRRGYVKKARASAVESLRKMYSLLPDVAVEIVDETPDGAAKR